ncbi:DJ-1 family glyoxalase III [Parendozoicomonas haliclonae]|uniref:Chaperone protein YajL n=1 Tax=Parendozoicomonas haliclonae TaxID=1960125 RepID=A0A1X7AEV4_9GAMM|nr:DJ-1 family glyoxalase III [Parendozoicomonas haliclonae]SMA33933.1 Chaperone protein YajL [Parendozoicomonas haliclonae]
MSKRILIPIADGTEELEAVTIIDILRRAECDVTVASCSHSPNITASRGVSLTADKMIAECLSTSWNMIALPGGIPGAENLRDSTSLTHLLKTQKNENRWIAAICAAPAVVLAHHGLLDNVTATSYPSFQDQLPNPEPDQLKTVITDPAQKIITSQGPGTAMSFALALVTVLASREKADLIARQMCAWHLL